MSLGFRGQVQMKAGAERLLLSRANFSSLWWGETFCRNKTGSRSCYRREDSADQQDRKQALHRDSTGQNDKLPVQKKKKTPGLMTKDKKQSTVRKCKYMYINVLIFCICKVLFCWINLASKPWPVTFLTTVIQDKSDKTWQYEDLEDQQGRSLTLWRTIGPSWGFSLALYKNQGVSHRVWDHSQKRSL